jgi:DNA-binding beta-propeller fold protein YncE
MLNRKGKKMLLKAKAQWVSLLRRCVVVGLAAVGASLVCAAVALAASGDLTPEGCVDDNDNGTDVCAQSVDGLSGAQSVAVSPDGKSVYIASNEDAAIARFERNTTSGALIYRGCLDDSIESCAQSLPTFMDPVSITVSPDGEWVYVVSRFAVGGIYRFKRNTTNGALSYRDCIARVDFPGTCAQSAPGLKEPTSVAVSPDGKSVYVADFGASTVVRFARTATGKLVSRGCVDDNDSTPDGCAQSVDGLGAADSIAVSPDGESVYVASAFDDAVVRFNRNTTSGTLGGDSCIDDNDTGSDFCAQQADGLKRAAGVTVSADGKSVYVTSEEDHAIVHFERKPTGALVPRGCLVDNDFPTESCADSPKGLDGASEVDVSADGKSVYVASSLDDAIVHFERDTTTGALIPISCIDDNDFTHTHLHCPQSTDGLNQPTDVVVSPDGESVYATSGKFSGGDHAIVHFTRETAP